MLANKVYNRQEGRQAGRQADRQAGRQAGRRQYNKMTVHGCRSQELLFVLLFKCIVVLIYDYEM